MITYEEALAEKGGAEGERGNVSLFFSGFFAQFIQEIYIFPSPYF